MRAGPANPPISSDRIPTLGPPSDPEPTCRVPHTPRMQAGAGPDAALAYTPPRQASDKSAPGVQGLPWREALWLAPKLLGPVAVMGAVVGAPGVFARALGVGIAAGIGLALRDMTRDP